MLDKPRYRLYKGTPTEYRELHYWVESQLGKPSFCVQCGSTDAKRYEWANISSEYKRDTKDWQRMCHACHFRMDLKKESCPRGHALIGDNLIIRKKGYRECRNCKNKANYDYRRRKGLVETPEERKGE